MDLAGGYREHDILVVTGHGAENVTGFPYGPTDPRAPYPSFLHAPNSSPGRPPGDPRPTCSGLRCRGTPRPSFNSIFAERPDHGLGVPVDDGEQPPRRPVGIAPALFSLLKSARVEAETPGELPAAQPEPLAESRNPAGSGVVDNPAW